MYSRKASLIFDIEREVRDGREKERLREKRERQRDIKRECVCVKG